jgi:hypothetical protein
MGEIKNINKCCFTVEFFLFNRSFNSTKVSIHDLMLLNHLYKFTLTENEIL